MKQLKFWKLTIQGVAGSVLGALFGVFFYMAFGAFCFEQNVAAENWLADVTRARDSLSVPVGVCLLFMLISALLGLAIAIFCAVRKASPINPD